MVEQTEQGVTFEQYLETRSKEQLIEICLEQARTIRNMNAVRLSAVKLLADNLVIAPYEKEIPPKKSRQRIR